MGTKMCKKSSILTNGITIFGAPIIVGLLLILHGISIFTTNQQYKQIQLNLEEPAVLYSEIGSMQTLLLQLDNNAQQWLTSKNEDGKTIHEEELQQYFDGFNHSIDVIRGKSSGEEARIEQLVEKLDMLEQSLMNLAEFCEIEGNGPEDIPGAKKEAIPVLFMQIYQEVQEIQIDSSLKIAQYGELISDLRKSAVVWGVIITATMLIAVGALQALIQKSRRKLINQSKYLDMISETVDEMFIIGDMDEQRSDFVSKGSERVLGIPCQEVRKNDTMFYQYLSEEDQIQIRTARAGVQTESATELQVDYCHPVTGETRCLALWMYRAETENRKLITMIVDVTEDTKVRRSLKEALVAAQNANNAKRDFLSHMSHEIKTPMNAIIGMSTIAAASIADSARVADCLEKINLSSKYLMMLINNILDMSKIESNKLVLNHESFDLMEFVNLFVAVTCEQSREKGILYEEKLIGFEKNTRYIGDTMRLNQILLNLMSNAIKFTDAGGRISLEIKRLDGFGGKERIRFTVQDTGIGMDERTLSRIYIPFEQGDGTISRKYGGTGLGMSITKSLVSLMDGVIDVTSKLGVGTCCVVEIPFQKADCEEESHENKADQRTPDTAALKGYRILIAEDNQLNLEITQDLLQMNGAFAEGAENGAEAVDKFCRSPAGYYDAILMDVQMPGMDGYTATRVIRSSDHPDARTIPIIAITANAFSEDISAALDSGMNAHSSKPLNVNKLVGTLADLTQKGLR